MRFIPYNKKLKGFSRNLRNYSTLGEILLWQKLKARKLKGYQFNRQKPLGNYIVDFHCQLLRLVIEVDGGYHNDPAVRVKDQERQKILENLGLNFLRFSDREVRNNLPRVLQVIEIYILNYEEKFPEVKERAKRSSKILFRNNQAPP